MGVDRLSETAKRFGLGQKVLNDFVEERSGVVPSTSWKKKYIGQNWYLGETLHSGIGQGYFQSTPLQLCLMTAQIANGGFEIKPRILLNEKRDNLREYIKFKNENPNTPLPVDMLVSNFDLKPLFRNQENVKFVLEAMYGSTNELYGTSYSSRFDDKKYQFAGKTGTAQVRRITERDRELDLELSQIPYERRDHALYIAYGPYVNPRYAISIIVEHGGSGGVAAAPIAKKLFKLAIDRHDLREKKRLEKIINT